MNDNESKIKYAQYVERLLPRMLTQVCRDPGSTAYGSFDRNWWHYKIRDFSSIILQQGGYALYYASKLPAFKEDATALQALAAASCRFWNDRAVRHGAFEEYYPWEQGYPPVAFSTLAVAKMVADGVVGLEEVKKGLSVAARQLQHRFESKATNQQVAGTAALCWIRKIAPELIEETGFQQICNRTLACQHEEGWYMEYGGPDLGYLSVTMDCLWDAYDATSDERFRASAAKALDFIEAFVAMPQRGAGMLNARNTDYIVPYGIARFLESEKHSAKAGMVLARLFENIDQPQHFLHATDDRYICHYIGHSLYRAIPLMMGSEVHRTEETINHYFDGCGIWLYSTANSGYAAMVSAMKGGILSVSFGESNGADYGWIVRENGREWVSHWWAGFWAIARNNNSIRIQGHLTPHRENISSPFKHVALRALSFLFGRRIISLLKEKMIFKEKQAVGPSYVRSITFNPDGIEVVDVIGVNDSSALYRAPRSSKRHVASADSYHKEDVALCATGICVEETRASGEGCIEIKTQYRRNP